MRRLVRDGSIPGRGGQPEDCRRTAEAGFAHHLVKPIEPKALEELLDGLTRAEG